MPFSQEKYDQVVAGTERALSSGSLNEWEQKFLSDMLGKLRKYGKKTTLSEKQYRKLMQLSGISTNAKPIEYNKASSAPHLQVVGKPKKFAVGKKRKSRTRRLIPRIRISHSKLLFFWIPLCVALVVLTLEQLETNSTSTSVVSSASSVLSSSSITVVDGDTIRVAGRRNSVRLVGFNTPETFEPVCQAGSALGNQATSRLKQLISNANSIELKIVRCACRPGTEGTRKCNYGRACGSLKVDEQDVGDVLISEGLAARFMCGVTSCPPTPRPWCG